MPAADALAARSMPCPVEQVPAAILRLTARLVATAPRARARRRPPDRGRRGEDAPRGQAAGLARQVLPRRAGLEPMRMKAPL